MGLITNKHTDNNCQLGIWKITETLDNLRSRIELIPEDIEQLEGFTFLPRKLEWLSVRVLLNEMTQRHLGIIYNGNRKPFVRGNSYHISISHSRDLTSILLSKDRQVGIDLEFMSHRISNLAYKFINDKEYVTDDTELKKYHLYVHWCAKEALYKICDKQDINFKENLTIEPFQPQESGELKGWVQNKRRNELFRMKYFSMGNYIIVWTSK
ncbi:MAG: 4'-phosphopantetheinyl transferase superfamily protein [Bacteroidales bacterium]|nr:4'-phosphopantetheinyl transferase superfamily protein [Bacteroidales bacterium]